MLGLVAVLLMLLAPRWFALLLFGDSRASSLATSLGAALGTVIAFNFLVELFTALRQIRVASLMQLANNVVFTVLSVGLLCFTGLGEQAVILAFGAGALAAIVGGGLRLRSAWRSLPPAARPLPCQELATKLLPFAAWVWLTNLLANLFVSADQYMIKHFSGLDAAAADSVVGQYYSSRIVPVLLIGAAGTLSSIILPHLSFDWEAGRRRAVSQRLNLALKLIGLAFTCGAALVMLGAPWLFGWVLHGKYSDGLAVLPWTLIYSAWFSLAVVAQNYLWCAEKAGLSSLALALGLAVDVALNLVLLPRFGLAGAVLAAAAANAAALAITYELSRRLGLERDRGVWVVSALPLAIAGGAGPAAAIVVLTGWFAARSSWLFNSREKQELAEAARSCLGRLQRLVGSREPASA
jgi:O-antigen/teichoic acid export membrane protein